MPVAKRPPSNAPIQRAVESLLRGLTYYAALLACVVIAIAVSFAVFLHLARDSVRDDVPGGEGAFEAKALAEFSGELNEIADALGDIAKSGDLPGEPFSRRLNDVRRRMRQFPHDSEALNALIQSGDRLIAWSATPHDPAARDRVRQSLKDAAAAVERRVEALR